PVNVSVSVSPTSPQPTGDVSLIATQGTNSTSVDTLTLSSGTASGSTNMLPGGASYSVQAHYAGDATYGGSDSNAVTVTVTPEASQTALRILTFDPISGQLINPNATTFNYGSAYLLRADVTNNSSTPCFNTTNATQSYACPTGNVALTDNGSAAGPGAFALNSQGSTEFQAIQLSGGSHTLAGSYSGDNSYNASSTTDPVTVTPAPTTTTITPPYPGQFGPKLVVGQQFAFAVTTTSSSLGAAPGGSYTVFDGTTQLSSQPGQISSTPGSPTSGAQIYEILLTTISGAAGPHTLSVRYSGDTNYAASTSAGVTVNAFYPIAMSATATPNSIVYGTGATVTIAVTVDTTNSASNAALKPTGSFSFYGSSDGNITSPVTTDVTQDSSGNWELQASITFTPQNSEFVYADYSGDSNYEPYPQNGGGGVPVSLTVIIPDFNVSAASSLAITAGQTGTETLTITPMTNYPSTVQLNCPQSNSPGIIPGFPGATCSISPSSVKLSNGAPATATLTITTLAPSSTLSANAPPVTWRGPMIAPFGRGAWWALSLLAGLATLFLIALPGKRRSLQAICALGSVCMLSFAIGCGGGASANSSGGGGGGGNSPASTTTTLTASAVKIAQGTSGTLSASVQSTAHPTGTVLIASSNCAFQYSNPLINGTAQIATPTWLTLGTCTVSATYGGDANNLASQSGALNIVFTGSTSVQIMAQTSIDTHLIPVTVTIQ
ncbi:MAG TPA: Ig-like domain-containing protein, partial [Candidatus Acidoferrales bacterium]|nr:Ig-like domain-containing protein [Candidatus Acidoferrales bacterium]